ncbi:hypothetical protein [Helicobacter saguini]|nr:hypothetical protein [Helicobacter saguini]MWV61626.1 hypothetical protein [Helicobacter saguini]MWV72733.1 hypothetical protein [Helicobacter saguini]
MISKNEIECLENCLCDIVLHNFQRMIKDCKGNDSKLEYLESRQDMLLNTIYAFFDSMRLENGINTSNDLSNAIDSFFNEIKKEAFNINAKKDLKNILKGSKDSSND